MRDASFNRFDWCNAVSDDHDLSHAARYLAYRVAVKYTNDETGQTNPSIARLCADLGYSKATIKRCIKALVDGGWLHRTEGRGAGNKTEYTLLQPGKIVRLRPAKKDQPAPEKKGDVVSLSTSRKGSQVSPKGIVGEPSYNKDKQSLEQKARARAVPDHDAFRMRFLGRATDGPLLVNSNRHPGLNAWAEWLRKRGLPDLWQLPIVVESDQGSTFFRLPWEQPPTEPDRIDQAREYFQKLIDHEGARHAAQ